MPRSCSAPCSPRMVRLSILDVTWKLIRVGKFALIVPVITSTEGRCVAMIRWMPQARAICARRWMQASISLPGDHHQVGHLVDDHHDVGDGDGLEFVRLEHRIAGFLVEPGLDRALEHLALGQRLAHAAVVALDVAHAHAWTSCDSVPPSRPRPISGRRRPSSGRSRRATAGAGCRHRRDSSSIFGSIMISRHSSGVSL